MPDNIFEMIFQTLYRYRVECGPNKSSYQYVPKAYNISVFDVPYIVPDNIIRPKIAITIDFNHVYTTTTKNKPGERLVSEKTLKDVTETLLSFYYYYFEYEFSYNKTWRGVKNQFRDALERSKQLTDTESMSEFINYILNFFLTNATVSRSINNIGTASFTLKDMWNVRNSERARLFFNKTVSILNQLFTPMLPVMIWAEGRIYKDWIFPLFSGFITSVTDANSEGFISITVNCRDALELARFSYEMVNPAVIQIGEDIEKTQQALNMFDKPFYNIDHFKLIQAMFVGGTILKPDTRERTILVGKKKSGLQSFDGLGTFDLVADFYDDESYSDRVLDQTPVKFADRKAIKKEEFSIYTGLVHTKHDRKRGVITWGAQITPYRVMGFSSIDVFQSQFDSRLAILQNTAKLVYYNLYVDGWGNIQYHPYRLSLKFIKNDLCYHIDRETIEHENIFPGAQIIGPEELLASSTTYNIEELITHLRLNGVPRTDTGVSELNDLVDGYTATTLKSRFGERRAEITLPTINNNPWVTDVNGKSMRFIKKAARELLTFMNAELYSRSDTLIFRPELEIALPLCILPEREVFYVQSITHSIDVGGSARTEINSNFGRSYLAPPPDLQSIIIEAEDFYNGKPGLGGEIVTSPGNTVAYIENKYEQAEKTIIDMYNA